MNIGNTVERVIGEADRLHPEGIELNEMLWMSPSGIDGVIVPVWTKEEGQPPAVLQGTYIFALVL